MNQARRSVLCAALTAISCLAIAGALPTSVAGAVGFPGPTVSARSVNPGGTVTISGSGCVPLDANSFVDVNVVNESDDDGDIHTHDVVQGHVTPHADGTWSQAFVVPANTPLGSYDVLTECFLVFDTNYLTTNVFGFLSVGSPTEALSAGSAAQGGTVTANLTGFEAGESVTATLHSTPVALGTFTASAGGNVHATLTIPATADPGNHEVVFVGQRSGQSTQADLSVTGPAVAPAPTPAAPTTAAGTTAASGGTAPTSAAKAATTTAAATGSASTSADPTTASPTDSSSGSAASGAVAGVSVTDADTSPTNTAGFAKTAGVARTTESTSAVLWISVVLLIILAAAGVGGTFFWRRRQSS